MVLSAARPVRMEWILRGYGGIWGSRNGGSHLERRRTLSARAETVRVRASMPKPEGLEERLKVAGDAIPVHLL
jgi:hypothetical protein